MGIMNQRLTTLTADRETGSCGEHLTAGVTAMQRAVRQAGARVRRDRHVDDVPVSAEGSDPKRTLQFRNNKFWTRRSGCGRLFRYWTVKQKRCSIVEDQHGASAG